MSVDLHLHSTYSDGTQEPNELVDRALAAGLTTMALTDHDGFEGIAEAAGAAAGQIGFIPGVELSIDWDGPGLHMLAWWVDSGSPLDRELVAVRESRQRRNVEIIAALNEMGHPVTVEQVERISEKGVIGRPHIARALIEHGVVSSVSEAFEQLLGSGKPAYRGRQRLTIARAVALVRESGGVTAVAHPHTVANDAGGFAGAFRRFAELGVDGVECWYPEYPPEQRTDMAAMARRYGLVPTGGSDCHGINKPGIEVGVGKGDLAVPDEVVEELGAKRPKPAAGSVQPRQP